MQILVLEEKQELLDLLTMNLKMNNSIEVIPQLTISDGKGFVDLLPDLKLVVINNSTQFDERLEIIDYILKEKDHIEMIVVSGTIKIEHPRLQIIERIANPEQLLDMVSKKFTENFLSQNDSAYAPVNIDNLKYFKTLPVDIYLKLKEGDRYKFVKVINAQDPLPSDFTAKYSSKQVADVFVSLDQKEDFSKAIGKLFLKLFKRRSQEDVISFENFEEIHQEAFQQIVSLGFSTIGVKLGMESVADLMHSLENKEKSKGLLSQIYRTDAPYSYRFSYMTSLVCHSLIKRFAWSNQKNIETLMYAALFSDFGLSEKELLIRDEEQYKAAIKNEDTTEALSLHAHNNAKRFSKVKGLPEDVVKVIIQHHGAHNGINFPRNISSQITPLSLCLIVAQEFVHFILNDKDKKNITKAVEHISQRYPSPKIENVLKELCQCITK